MLSFDVSYFNYIKRLKVYDISLQKYDSKKTQDRDKHLTACHLTACHFYKFLQITCCQMTCSQIHAVKWYAGIFNWLV